MLARQVDGVAETIGEYVRKIENGDEDDPTVDETP